MDKDILLYIVLGIGLVICTITDLKKREIYLPVIIFEILFVAGFHIWHKSFSPISALGALIVCLLFVVVGFISGGQIGLGDAFLFAVTGLGLGIMANIFIIMLSFILAFCMAIFLVVIKHKSHNYSMPFAPFILSAFTCYLIAIYLPM